MRPDFIITQRQSPDGPTSIVLPTHTGALNWMFAHVDAATRHGMSAHLGSEKLAHFKSEVAVAGMTFAEPSSPQPAGGGK
ncbi:MAG: hypothetical protein ACJ71W_00805 [Terriglobales bacterium]